MEHLKSLKSEQMFKIIERMMNLEDCFVSVNAPITRVEKDRILRSYRAMNGVLHSARAYGRYFAADDIKDDAVIQAQMYSLRASVLAVEDARERLFLYHYYIKGNTLPICAKIHGVSLRTISRLKN